MTARTNDLGVLLHGDGEHAVVELVGDLNASTVPFLRDVVEQLLADPGSADRIELHLDNLDDCDAAGMDLLVHLERAAKLVRRELVVVRPSAAVRDALERVDRAPKVAI